EEVGQRLVAGGGARTGPTTAAATPFTVAGIESDDNGTVSFSDGTHAPVVVNIVNGVLSATTANLAGLNDGPVTVTLHLNNDAARSEEPRVGKKGTHQQDTDD